MIRRFGEPLVRGQSYRIRHGVYAVLPHGRDVLLTHQAEPEPEFQLPGGGIDPGESPLRALHREVFEETGWSIAAPRRIDFFAGIKRGHHALPPAELTANFPKHKKSFCIARIFLHMRSQQSFNFGRIALALG